MKLSQLKIIIRSKLLHESYARFGTRRIYLLEAPEREIVELIKLNNEPKIQALLKTASSWPAQVEPEQQLTQSQEEKSATDTLNQYRTEITKSLQNLPGSYLGWLRAMSKGDPEPLSEIISIAKSYDKYKAQLKRPLSLKEFPSVGSLRQAIESLGTDSQATDSNSGSLEISGNEIVYSGLEWVVYYPLTEAGSIASATSNKIAKGGVQWCTAATKSENYFNDYSGESNIHLYYCIRRGGNTLRPDTASDKTCIGIEKESSGRARIIQGANATVDSQNRDLSLSELSKIFGHEWSAIQQAVLSDAAGKKETSYNKMLQNMTVEDYEKQEDILRKQGKKPSEIYDLQEKLLLSDHISPAVIDHFADKYLTRPGWAELGIYMKYICANKNTSDVTFNKIINVLSDKRFVHGLNSAAETYGAAGADKILEIISNNKSAPTTTLLSVIEFYRQQTGLRSLKGLYTEADDDQVRFALCGIISNPNVPSQLLDEAAEVICAADSRGSRAFDSNFIISVSENPSLTKKQLKQLLTVQDTNYPKLRQNLVMHKNMDSELFMSCAQRERNSFQTISKLLNNENLPSAVVLYIANNTLDPYIAKALITAIGNYKEKMPRQAILNAIETNEKLAKKDIDSLVSFFHYSN